MRPTANIPDQAKHRTKPETYPVRFTDKKSGMVVEFDSLTSGKVVKEGRGYAYYVLGTYNKHWTPHTNMDIWAKTRTIKESIIIPYKEWILLQD